MLWVLKRPVSMRRFFWAPKNMLKLMGKETNASLGAQTILIWTYGNKQTAVTDPNSWYWYWILTWENYPYVNAAGELPGNMYIDE